MQTFLPYPNFKESAQVLDTKRLGKQRLEALTILRNLNGSNKGWLNHPIVKMWKGYENALSLYYNSILEEWINRGFKNTMKPIKIIGNITLPPWIGNKEFHLSHKSNLLRKNEKHYSKYFQNIPNNLEYVWIK